MARIKEGMTALYYNDNIASKMVRVMVTKELEKGTFIISEYDAPQKMYIAEKTSLIPQKYIPEERKKFLDAFNKSYVGG